MVQGYYRDTETGTVKEVYAVIYAPRRKRDRFPENCVQVQESESDALTNADPDKKFYPAKVAGPARSSEGFMMYYLIAWLDD